MKAKGSDSKATHSHMEKEGASYYRESLVPHNTDLSISLLECAPNMAAA